MARTSRAGNAGEKLARSSTPPHWLQRHASEERGADHRQRTQCSVMSARPCDCGPGVDGTARWDSSDTAPPYPSGCQRRQDPPGWGTTSRSGRRQSSASSPGCLPPLARSTDRRRLQGEWLRAERRAPRPLLATASRPPILSMAGCGMYRARSAFLVTGDASRGASLHREDRRPDLPHSRTMNG